MRRLRELLVSLLLVFTYALLSFGEPVDLDTAVELGEVHLRAAEKLPQSSLATPRSSVAAMEGRSVSGVRELRVNGRLLAYILDLSPEGCIIVSPNTDIHPVIAYSFEGKFSMVDSEENVFLHLVIWDMQNRIDALPATSLALKEKNNALWERYLTKKGNSSIQAVADSGVWGPYLQTEWSQGIPYREQGYIYPDYDFGDYNRYCPIGHSSEWRCVTGCGLLAMAQIVNYWKYPSSLNIGESYSYTSNTSYSINGTSYNLSIDIDDDHVAHDFPGFTELSSKLSQIRYYDGDLYFWDPGISDYRSPVDEDPNLDAAARQEIKEDIAALCFTCGILLHARYSPVGTSAPVSYNPGGTMEFSPFTDDMGYSSAVIADINWSQFYTSLEANMKDSQPAMLLVDSQSGTQSHFVVADGYRDEWEGGSEGYYHLNFGWGTANPDSVSDSWYHLPEGMPQPNGMAQYSVVKLGVMDIYPPAQQNTPPVASNLSISPSSPRTGDNLAGSYSYYDADGDPESGSEIRWYKNGSEQGAYYGLLTVPSAGTTKGDVWYFTVRPRDGTDFGTLQTSSSVTIGNTPPVASSLSVSPSSPRTGDNLTGSYSYYDADNDPQNGSQIRWYKNGSEQGAYYGLLTVPSAGTTKGDVWYFTVRPRDGTDFGALQTSSSVTIGNTPPVASNPNITPSSPTPASDLVANYGYSDADGDSESGSEIIWYRNGAEEPAYYGLTTIPAAETLDGETWYFTVTPCDGTDFGDMKTSGSVTITMQILQRNIELYPGWNFISIYLDVGYTDLLSVLDQIKDRCISVHHYDAAAGRWMGYFFDGPAFLNDLTTIEPKKGYWLNMESAATLTITGPDIADTAVQLVVGQNHAGYNRATPKSCAEALSSIDGNYAIIWSYNNGTGTWLRYAPAGPPDLNTLTQLIPGNGYSIEVTIGCIWTP